MSEHVMTIGGKAAATSGTFNVLNPFDESKVGECPSATPSHVDEAVSSARRALSAWAAMPDDDACRN